MTLVQMVNAVLPYTRCTRDIVQPKSTVSDASQPDIHTNFPMQLSLAVELGNRNSGENGSLRPVSVHVGYFRGC